MCRGCVLTVGVGVGVAVEGLPMRQHLDMVASVVAPPPLVAGSHTRAAGSHS